MPVVLVQGRTAHVSRCFDGLNAVGVLGRMFEKTELSAEFVEVFDGEVCMPPTWLNFKDLKKEYDVSVPARAAGYLSVLSFRSGPGEILEKMRELGSEAFAEYIEKMDAERRRLEEKLSGRAMQGKKKCVKTAKPQAANAESVDHADPVSEEYADNVGECEKTNDVVPQKFNVLSFEELSEQCRKKNADGFEDFLEGLKDRTEARIRSGETNYPQATIDMMTEVLDWSGLTEPVMVIGFVSAGLLELPRAVAVIYGINIGTTMTAQLIAFDVQTLVYPVLFLGFLLDFAACRPRWRAVGEAVFSFGLLFEGIDILGRALQPLAGQAVFLDWMTRVKESPLLGILLGLSMTMVVQSSSATIALLQNVARQAGPDGIHSVLGLAGAVPVLLGDNIGTTVTALLACIGQGKDAARAALAHSCFNLSGSLLAAVLLPWFVRLVELISPKGPELEIISRQIANAHTAFNVCCALLWLPFLPWMVRLVCALVPEKEKK